MSARAVRGTSSVRLACRIEDKFGLRFALVQIAEARRRQEARASSTRALTLTKTLAAKRNSGGAANSRQAFELRKFSGKMSSSRRERFRCLSARPAMTKGAARNRDVVGRARSCGVKRTANDGNAAHTEPKAPSANRTPRSRRFTSLAFIGPLTMFSPDSHSAVTTLIRQVATIVHTRANTQAARRRDKAFSDLLCGSNMGCCWAFGVSGCKSFLAECRLGTGGGVGREVADEDDDHGTTTTSSLAAGDSIIDNDDVDCRLTAVTTSSFVVGSLATAEGARSFLKRTRLRGRCCRAFLAAKRLAAGATVRDSDSLRARAPRRPPAAGTTPAYATTTAIAASRGGSLSAICSTVAPTNWATTREASTQSAAHDSSRASTGSLWGIRRGTSTPRECEDIGGGEQEPSNFFSGIDFLLFPPELDEDESSTSIVLVVIVGRLAAVVVVPAADATVSFLVKAM